jgi:hypothetical protein
MRFGRAAVVANALVGVIASGLYTIRVGDSSADEPLVAQIAR